MSSTLAPFSPYALSLGLGFTPLTYLASSSMPESSTYTSPAFTMLRKSSISSNSSDDSAASTSPRTSGWAGNPILQQHSCRLHRGPALSIGSAPSSPSLSRSSSTSSNCSLNSASSSDHTVDRAPWHFEEAPASRSKDHAYEPSIQRSSIDIPSSWTRSSATHAALPHIAIAQSPTSSSFYSSEATLVDSSATLPSDALAPAKTARKTRRSNSTPSGSAKFPEHSEFHLMFGRVD